MLPLQLLVFFFFCFLLHHNTIKPIRQHSLTHRSHSRTVTPPRTLSHSHTHTTSQSHTHTLSCTVTPLHIHSRILRFDSLTLSQWNRSMYLGHQHAKVWQGERRGGRYQTPSSSQARRGTCLLHRFSSAARARSMRKHATSLQHLHRCTCRFILCRCAIMTTECPRVGRP